MTTIGIVHPGEMGAAIGATLAAQDHTIVWASDQRSAATSARAGRAGLADRETLAALAAESDIVVSVCPPGAAVEVVEAVLDAGFAGIYVDANAISPTTARAIAARVERAGAVYVDGGIIGPPPRAPGTTRLYLSGKAGASVASVLTTPLLDVRVVDDRPTSASALKLVYASYTKGLSMLLLALRATARNEGVDEALLGEWAISQPTLAGICEIAAAQAGAKAWRWETEMNEIAVLYSDAGMPAGFHLAAAEMCRALAGLENASTVDLDTVIGELGR